MVNYSSITKQRIILFIYLIPLVITAFFTVLMLTRLTLINVVCASILALAYITRIVFNKRKYVTGFRLADHVLEIDYLSVFFTQKTDDFQISKISNVEVTTISVIFSDTHGFNLKYGDDWFEYYTLSKDLDKLVKEKLCNLTLHPEQ